MIAEADDALSHRSRAPVRGRRRDDRHQRARHAGRVVVLDHVAAVDDAGRALAHHRLGAAQHLLVGRAAAAAHEHRPLPGASTTRW